MEILDQEIFDQPHKHFLEASKSKRAANFIIDYFAYLFLIMTVFYTSMEYFLNGKSLGKFITKTRAVKVNGDPITFSDALKRSACRSIPFEVFSFLGKNRSGLHDSISKTKVIDEKKSINLEQNPSISDINS